MRETTTTNITAMRRAILSRLRKKKIEYSYSLLLSRVYDGEGFYVNHYTRVNEVVPVWGYDYHWAYGGVLKNNLYPLSSKLTNDKTPLGLYMLEFEGYARRYKGFYYSLYRKKFQYYKKNDKIIFFIILTNLDFEIFMDMYILKNLKILKVKYFKDVGELPFNDIIDKYYILKKKSENKTMFEAAFYGIFAMNINKAYLKKSRRNIKKYVELQVDTGLEPESEEIKEVRNSQVPIAMFQTAHQRYKEWQLFKQYQKNIIYMNTDSIYTNVNINLETSPEVGKLGKCKDGDTIYWIRRNAYVTTEKRKIKESVIGGVLNGGDITFEKLEKLRRGESIKTKMKNLNNEIIEGILKPKFLLFDYD